MRLKLMVLSAIVLVLVQSAMGLQCYNCDSQSKSESKSSCDDLNFGILKNCTGGRDACFKFHYVNENGDGVYYRDCAYLTDHVVACESATTPQDDTASACYCQGDKCNTAQRMVTSVAGFVASLTIIAQILLNVC